MLYAIIESGDKQFRVSKGTRINVPLMDAEPEGEVTFDRVLLCSNGEEVCIGTPVVDAAQVKGTCLGEAKDEKIRVFKMKRRKKYRRTKGHRQSYTEVRIDEIVAPIEDQEPADPAPEAAPTVNEEEATDAAETTAPAGEASTA